VKGRTDTYTSITSAGWYLRQKPVGGSKAGGLPHPSLPLSLPSPFHSPYISDKPVRGKVRSSEGEVPRLQHIRETYRSHTPGQMHICRSLNIQQLQLQKPTHFGYFGNLVVRGYGRPQRDHVKAHSFSPKICYSRSIAYIARHM